MQELLGHESLATTQIYTHVSPGRLRDAYRTRTPGPGRPDGRRRRDHRRVGQAPDSPARRPRTPPRPARRDPDPRAGRDHRHGRCSCVSRVLGYLRYVVIAAAVPDPAQLDSFFAAFRIPDFLFQLVAAGALSSALIPVIAGLFATERGARAWRVVSTVTTLMLSALLVLAGVVLLFAPALVALITPGLRRGPAGADRPS